jgi:cell wall-associated NlpC family hydrolase
LKASNATSSRKDLHPAERTKSADSSSSTIKRFQLSGPSLILDERLHAYRRDLADIALAGQLFAPHYARPQMKSCGTRPAFVYPSPSTDAPISSELLPGEEFAVLEISGGWAWGYCRHDHYVGYVEAIELVDAPPATHVVAAVEAEILPEPDIHVPPLAKLPMAARTSGHEEKGFLATDVGFIAFTQVRPLQAYEHDPVAVAERLLGAPYLLGGRSPRGIDCSGLVQVSHAFCGIRTPRDSDQQRVLGELLPEDVPLQRGDLIFLEGHVGLMADADRLIHATAHTNKVLIEPLADVAARNPVLQRRRLP